LVAVGSALYLEVSAKQAVGIALLGIAFSWLVGNLTRRGLSAAFGILLCASGFYVVGAPVWSDWNSVKKSAAEYDDAIAALQGEVKAVHPARLVGFDSDEQAVTIPYMIRNWLDGDWLNAPTGEKTFPPKMSAAEIMRYFESHLLP
jgi:hypothetical protein